MRGKEGCFPLPESKWVWTPRWQGDFIVLWIERRGPYTRFLGLKYLSSTASKKVTHSGSNSCEVDPSGPVVGAQEEAELEPCRPHWGLCNREGGLTRHTKILMPAIQITSTICLVSQRNSTANKIQLKSRSVCFVPTTILPLPLSLKEPFQVSQGKRRALNQLWSFKWTGKLWNLLKMP